MAKKNTKKEVSELEQTYHSIAGKKSKKAAKQKSGKGRIAAIIAGVFALLLVGGTVAVLYFFPNLLNPEKISVSMKIAGVDVTGMKKEEAINAVSVATQNTYSQKTMVVTAGDMVIELTPAISGIKLNVEAAVDAACKMNAPVQDMDLTPYLTVNTQAIKAELNKISQANETALIHSKYEVTGSVNTATGETDKKLIITVGQPGLNSDINMIYEAVWAAYQKNEFQVNYPLKMVEPNAPDLDAINAEHSQAAVDAVMDMTTFEVSDHAYGFTFDLEDAKSKLKAAEYNQVFEVPFQAVKPAALKEDLQGMLYRDVLGSYTAKSSSKPNTRDVNLKLSCEKINGTILFPGDTFDYDNTLGERTGEGGWKKADGYANGDTVSVYGGGICQASSALYYCSLIADIEIVTRFNHSYVSSYMPLGMDATVSWKGPNLIIKNTTQYPIRIEAKAEGGNTTVRLIGTDTKDYYVKMEYTVLSRTPFETKYEEVTKAEANGRKDGDVKVSGYVGHKVVTYKCKYSKDTDELISREEEVVSTYKKRDKIVIKIVEDKVDKPITPPTTEPTTPPETEPSTPPTTEPSTPPETEPSTPPSSEPPTTETDPPITGGGVTEDS